MSQCQKLNQFLSLGAAPSVVLLEKAFQIFNICRLYGLQFAICQFVLLPCNQIKDTHSAVLRSCVHSAQAVEQWLITQVITLQSSQDQPGSLARSLARRRRRGGPLAANPLAHLFPFLSPSFLPGPASNSYRSKRQDYNPSCMFRLRADNLDDNMRACFNYQRTIMPTNEVPQWL